LAVRFYLKWEQNQDTTDAPQSGYEKAKAVAKNLSKDKDVVIDDIDDEPIDLADIPF
jgi:hypothetical protein